MGGRRGLWEALEGVPGLCGVAADWRPLLGNEYEAASRFMRPTGGTATVYPCPSPRPCWCAHDVVRHGPGDIVAVCTCEPRECDTVPLREADLVLYEVNRRALGDAVATALGATPEHTTVAHAPMTWSIGTYSPRAGARFPVYLTVQLEAADLGRVVDSLVARAESPFVLIAPTRRLFRTAHEEPLRRVKACFLALSDDFALDAAGEVTARRPVVDILSPFLSAVLPPEQDRLVFRRQGRVWEVLYAGVGATVDHSVGMAYIQRLLQSPGREVPASLVRSVGAGRRGAPVAGSAGEVTDRQAVRAARKRIAAIDDELRDAEAQHDIERAESLQEEREELQAYVSAGTDHRGDPRETGGYSEHDRQAVSRGIHRALEAIEGKHTALAQHLRNALRIGVTLCYQPDRATVWAT